MRDSDRTWRLWGETDPYFGVLADPRFRREAFRENADEFFASGRAYVEDRLVAAECHLGPFGRRRALDFGCGVGRLTIPIADQFEEVIGLDVAPAMLEEARCNAATRALGNAHFALSDDSLSAAEGPFDLVISCMVLQHIPVRRGLGIIQRLLGLVARDGIAALHVCIDRNETPAQALRYWLRCHVPGMHHMMTLGSKPAKGNLFMQMNAYPLGKILVMADSLGFGPALIRTDWHGRFVTTHLLMRRQSAS